MSIYFRWLFIIFATLVVITTAIVEWKERNIAPTPFITSTPDVTILDDVLKVTSPAKNARISSPLTVTGSARGTWYFEASFPIRLLDSTGKEIAVTPAQAKTDWMTTDYVEFEATLSFSPPATATGTLVLERSNPSGLPANDQRVEIPVRFQ